MHIKQPLETTYDAQQHIFGKKSWYWRDLEDDVMHRFV